MVAHGGPQGEYLPEGYHQEHNADEALPRCVWGESRSQMTGLEDLSSQFMSRRGVPPGAENLLVAGRSVAPSITECHPIGGQKGGQDFAVSQALVTIDTGGEVTRDHANPTFMASATCWFPPKCEAEATSPPVSELSSAGDEMREYNAVSKSSERHRRRIQADSHKRGKGWGWPDSNRRHTV